MASVARKCALSAFVALACLGLGVSQASGAQSEYPAKPPVPLTAAQTKAATDAGLSSGKAAKNAADSNIPEFEEGEANTEGRVKINGKWERTQDVTGGGYNKAKAARANAVEASGNMNDLKAVHDATAAEIKAEGKTTAGSQALDTAWQSSEVEQSGREQVNNTEWTKTIEAVEDGKQGKVLGQDFANCDTSTTVIPGTRETTINEEFVCEQVMSPSNKALCTRERTYSVSPGDPVSGEKSSELFINENVNQQFCSRETRAEYYRDSISGTKSGDLNITEETAGQLCRRELVADATTITEHNTLDSNLNVDTQSGGNLCKRTLVPTNTTVVNSDSQGGTLGVNTEAPGESGRVSVWAENSTTTQTGTRAATLPIDSQSSGNVCTRTIWPSSSSSTTGVYQDTSLFVDQQDIGGLMCRREVFATTTGGTTPGSKSALLNVNTDGGGLSCSRTIVANTSSSTSAGSKAVTANVNNEVGGQSCTRNRWVEEANAGSQVTTQVFNYGKPTIVRNTSVVITNLSSYVPAGTTSLDGLQFIVNNQNAYTPAFWMSDAPTAANGWQATVQWNGECEYDAETRTSWCAPGDNTAHFVFTPRLMTRSWSIRESGDCSDTGSPSCPAVWRCDEGAPAGINGIVVTAAEVQALGALYPGSADSTCVRSSLARTCGGTGTTSNNFFIGDALQLGTQSIAGFQATIQNAQPGVSAVVTQVPAEWNGWVASIRIDRTDFSYTPNPVQLTLAWNQNVTTNTPQIITSGNCADGGTASCPVQWSCVLNAPSNTGSGTVTSAIAAGFAPLFPGAASVCVRGELHRTCGGVGGTSTAISIADQIHAGVSSISGFNFSVTNPQSGVSVSVIQAPTLANAWVVVFQINRSDWSYTPTNPNVYMTWNGNTSTTTVNTRAFGDCAAAGSANCPALWSCETNAPTTIDGQAITSAMTAQVAPLFPGAASTCARGRLDKVCSGTAIRYTYADLASRMPAGTTTVSSVNFTVLNPQAGVSVVLENLPTLANGWTATFRVERSSWSYVPTFPQIRITWNATTPTTDLTVVDSGDCTNAGSVNCPAVWSCATSAPTTINGITVTSGMAASQAPLFAGASSSCAIASKNRVCSGTSTTSTNISIASDIPAGVSAISAFAFSVSNPQSGVSVVNTQVPSAANGWIAVFRVDRSSYATQQAAPNIVLTWSMQVPSVAITKITTGNVTDAGSAACPTQWTCRQSAPTTINGIAVSAAQAASVAPLFPGAASACTVGTLDRVCGGTAGGNTSLSIAAKIPADVSAIYNFAFTVNNPQAGITVVNTQVPAAGNSWVAIFRVDRTNFTYTPASPTINMTWNYDTILTSVTVADTGNCALSGSPHCPSLWSCSTTAPTTLNGIAVSAALASTKAPLYPGAPSTCAVGSLDKVCGGTASVQTSISIASVIPVGTTTISNFTFSVLNPQSGVTVVNTQLPAQGNSWIAIFRVDRTAWSTVPVSPQIHMEWDSTRPAVAAHVEDVGDCAATGTPACPAVWSCTESAPTLSNGMTISPALAATFSPLFPGASNSSCTKAVKAKVCSGSSATDSTISIADAVTPDATEISNFQWTYNNPNAALSVVLVTAPALANNWLATFRVTRNYASGTVPPKPNVTLSWTMLSVKKIRVTVVTGGTCAGGGVGGMAVQSAPTNPSQAVASSGSSAAPMASGTRTAETGSLLERATGLLSPKAHALEPPTDPGSCPIIWVCTTPAPGTVNGIPLTSADLIQRGELYPGENYTCLVAAQRSDCAATGTGSNLTTVSIADKVAEYVETITDFTWSVVSGGAGVSVALVQAPTKANGWAAIFKTERTDWNVTPSKPTVKLTWGMVGPPKVTWGIVDTGDCSASGDAFCVAKWRCLTEAPPRPTVTYSPVTITQTWAISPNSEDVEMSIAGSLPTPPAYNSFSWQVLQSRNVSVMLLEEPSAANAWVALFRITKTSGGGGGGGGTGPGPGEPPVVQQIVMEGNASAAPNMAMSVVDALSPKAQAAICTDCGGGGGGGSYYLFAKIAVTFTPGPKPEDVKPPYADEVPKPPIYDGAPPLYDAPPPACMKAEKYLDCGSTWIGEECYIDSDGVERCVNQPPPEDGKLPDTCGEYESNPNCTLLREECTEGGMSSIGFCHVKSKLYGCKKTRSAENPVVNEVTTCSTGASGLTPVCVDGSCYDEETRDTTNHDMTRPAARMMIAQHQMKDKVNIGGAPIQQVLDAEQAAADDELAAQKKKRTPGELKDWFMDAVAPTALAAQDAFTLPPNYQNVPDEDVDGGLPSIPAGADINNFRFFAGKKRDCMKALGGLLNCCKKSPPVDQGPVFWKYLEEHLRKTSNAQGREDTAGEKQEGGWADLMSGKTPTQEQLMQQLTSSSESLKGGGTGSNTDTDSSIQNAYDKFKAHETTVVKPKLGWYCDSDEFELAVGRQIGTCTHLGSFCQTKVLGMCVIKKDRYCCFNSPVSRVLREHLQRLGVSSLGSAKRPNCSGITVQQMSMINPGSGEEDEIIGRMDQGEFLPNMAEMSTMDQASMESLLDGMNSALGDKTRKSPTDRNQERLGQVDTAGSYASIEQSQKGYRPPADTSTGYTAHDSTVSIAGAQEFTLAPGYARNVVIQRDGAAGGALQLTLAPGGASTAVVGRDYVIEENPVASLSVGAQSRFTIRAPQGAVEGGVVYLTLSVSTSVTGVNPSVRGVDTIKITIKTE